MSPDPLTVHAASSDPNPYAYVFGRPLSAVDPMGLECVDDLNHGCSKDITYGVSPNLLKSAWDWTVGATDTVKSWFKGGGQHVEKGGSSAKPSGRVPYDRNGGEIFPTPAPNNVATLGFDMVTRVQIDTNRVDTRPQNVKNEEMVIGVIGTMTPVIGEATAANILARGGVEALAMADSEAVTAANAAKRFGNDPKCFAAGTPIATENGSTPIEDIHEGTLVWTRDPETGALELQRAVRTFVHEDDQMLLVTLTDAEGARDAIHVTTGHPFWVVERGWVFSGALRPGDHLLSRTSTDVRVAGVARLERPEVVYNFEVAEDHSYFVGVTNAWVHNQCFQPADGAAQGQAWSRSTAGSAGPNSQWHHVVEQNPTNLARFGPGPIQNTGNIINLDTTVHRSISAYYSSIDPAVSSSMTVRSWVSAQPYAVQQQFGLDAVRSALGARGIVFP